MTARYEHFQHQADIGVRGIGPTIEEAFEQGAIGLTQVICDYETVEPATAEDIHCQAPDIELLFADWLNQLILQMAVNGMLYRKFEVHIDGSELHAKAWGEKADPEKHDIAVEVKAATYSELKVYRNAQGDWAAQCVVDV
ncbi:hypothetical protein STSP2_01745 [Anaerohalosphaera lusitana]|uniref:Archease domain-containing protein n=1 Tax=Anaerohalosphaera lusitana TaxID=1936003 RepID=A0A1U9NL97_9BACT|nr:archease [Anaerohalosphaera lusitana]AQT68577.1 hypothetical protein STSP2_01745 [Anaerohalosphaera lusitana]